MNTTTKKLYWLFFNTTSGVIRVKEREILKETATMYKVTTGLSFQQYRQISKANIGVVVATDTTLSMHVFGGKDEVQAGIEQLKMALQRKIQSMEEVLNKTKDSMESLGCRLDILNKSDDLSVLIETE